jgi:hypothetical protein
MIANYDQEIERRYHPENFLLDDDIADFLHDQPEEPQEELERVDKAEELIKGNGQDGDLILSL